MYFWWFDCDEKLHHRVESQMKAGDIDWTPSSQDTGDGG